MATLQIIGDKDYIGLNTRNVQIGRAAGNALVLNDVTVSNEHAMIVCEKTEDQEIYFIEDLESTNHTYVNNKEVTRHRLCEGDIIRIGNIRLKFSTKLCAVDKPAADKTTKINSANVSHFLVAR